jgi:hypothetical protein
VAPSTSPRRSRIIVVLTAYNEEANLASLLHRIFEVLGDEQTGFSIRGTVFPSAK